jgi:cytosine/adenosine deaminase-related metal-dependent hydrolase
MLADLVAVRLDGVRLAGTRPEDLVDALVFAGAAADVSDVVVGGQVIVRDGRHVRIDVARELEDAIKAVRS